MSITNSLDFFNYFPHNQSPIQPTPANSISNDNESTSSGSIISENIQTQDLFITPSFNDGSQKWFNPTIDSLKPQMPVFSLPSNYQAKIDSKKIQLINSLPLNIARLEPKKSLKLSSLLGQVTEDKIRLLLKYNLEKILNDPSIERMKEYKTNTISKVKKKNNFISNFFSMTVTPNGRCFAHLPQSNFNAGGIKNVFLAVNLVDENKEILVRTRLKKNSKNKNNGSKIAERCGGSPYLIQIYAVNPATSEAFIKFYPDGDFTHLLKDRNKVKQNIKNIFISMAAGVLTLHENKFIHNDLKEDNFMLTGDSQIPVVLGDFDFVFDGSEGLAGMLIFGTYLYMAPEKFDTTIANLITGTNKELEQQALNLISKTDVYSLGVIFYRMLQGRQLPWFKGLMDQSAANEIRLIANKLRHEPMFFTNHFPEPGSLKPFLHLIWEMLQPNPEKRPSMKEVVDRLKNISEDAMKNEFKI